MKLDIFRISLNRKTGKQLGKEYIRETQKDKKLVAEASVALLTGLTMEEAYKAISKAFNEVFGEVKQVDNTTIKQEYTDE